MEETKKAVTQKKVMICIVIFVVLGILLCTFLLSQKDGESTSDRIAAGKYKPGVYNSQITIGDSTLNLELVVDADHIKSVSFTDLEDSVTTRYPLLKPSLAFIETELVKGTGLDDIPVSEKRRYTETLLIEGIRTALDKALVDPV